MPGIPKRGQRFGGDAAHQKAMMGNLVAHLIAAEAIVTTEAKAKALRPVAEKMITKAKKGGLNNYRLVKGFIRDREMTTKLFDDIGPRYEHRPGGYTRILKLGPRPGDNAPMARIELVEKTADDLLAITNFGQKSLDEVLAKLDERGLSLRVKEG